MEFAFRLLGSFILVSREFDEKLRPGPEPLGPVSISKPYTFCTGCQNLGARAPGDVAGSPRQRLINDPSDCGTWSLFESFTYSHTAGWGGTATEHRQFDPSLSS